MPHKMLELKVVTMKSTTNFNGDDDDSTDEEDDSDDDSSEKEDDSDDEDPPLVSIGGDTYDRAAVTEVIIPEGVTSSIPFYIV